MSRLKKVPTTYVPILKGREGEYGALRTLAASAKLQVHPVIEVPPISWGYAEEQPAKSIDDHISTVIPKIQRAWGTEPAWLDLLWISEKERLLDGRHPVEFLFDVARSVDMRLVPVTGLLRDDEYQEAVRQTVLHDGRGLMLRTQLPDFEDPAAGHEAIDNLLGRCSCSPEDADLVLDLGPISPTTASAIVLAAIGVLQSLRHLSRWRTLSVVAGSFPENLVGLLPGDVSLIAREEWLLWRSLINQAAGLQRVLLFGDYAITHPEPSEVDPRIMRPSASVRYTTDEHWLVPKGLNLRAHGFGQFHKVCEELIGRAEYSGQCFSWGDNYIWKCARHQSGPGNLTTWRKVGTSHHLTFVARQLSSLAVASDAA